MRAREAVTHLLPVRRSLPPERDIASAFLSERFSPDSEVDRPSIFFPSWVCAVRPLDRFPK